MAPADSRHQGVGHDIAQMIGARAKTNLRTHLPELQQVQLAQPDAAASEVGTAPEVRAQHLDGGVARALVGPAEQPPEFNLGGVEVEVRIERISKGGGGGGGGGGAGRRRRRLSSLVGEAGVGDVGPRACAGRFDPGLLLPRVGRVGTRRATLSLREGRALLDLRHRWLFCFGFVFGWRES
jgi:hypothetical protein